MEEEIFDFDPVNEQNAEKTQGVNDDNNNNNIHNVIMNKELSNLSLNSINKDYSIVNMLEKEFADQERREKGEHDYNALQEGHIFDYLNKKDDINNDLSNNNNINNDNDEEAYDRYIPTDANTVNEYLKKLNNNNNDNDNKENNLKLKYIEKSENDCTKIRFNKGIIGMYVPPENFARVCEGIYRSSFPRIENFEFLKSLKLKSILCLIPEEYPIENFKFNENNKIKFYQIGLSGNKEPFVKIKPELVSEAIKILINPKNQPILIHCNRGKHRTGCIVGCIRKLQKWSYSMIFDEYRKFAYPKERPLDQQFIEMYNSEEVENYAIENYLLPIQW